MNAHRQTTSEWPEDFLESIIIPIEKKSGAQECVDLRMISLISHASKIVLKILTRTLKSKAEPYLGRDQYGYMRGCGTRDAIGAMRVLCDRSLEHNNKVFVCYVDYEQEAQLKQGLSDRTAKTAILVAI